MDPKPHEEKALEILGSIIKHGFGEISIVVHEVRDYKTKVVIKAGRSWVFFIEKDMPNFKKENML